MNPANKMKLNILTKLQHVEIIRTTANTTNLNVPNQSNQVHVMSKSLPFLITFENIYDIRHQNVIS